MTTAAADAAAALPDASRARASLLPPMTPLRKASAAVGVAVAHAAMAEGLNRVELTSPIQPVHDAMWQPDCPNLHLID